MNPFASHDTCTQDGCGHPRSEHVGDHVRRPHGWVTVNRCITCEAEGGSCTEGEAVLEGIERADEAAS